MCVAESAALGACSSQAARRSRPPPPRMRSSRAPLRTLALPLVLFDWPRIQASPLLRFRSIKRIYPLFPAAGIFYRIESVEA